ncbi:MAG TPA: hypothetical protein VFI72_08000 [Candidatus Angelobacter sp.]|nr:hypothetical protein [Candidatus Angelobacter sp.]
MHTAISCPVCGRTDIEPVLKDVKVTAMYEDFEGDIGALAVLRCLDFGHIFFVRKADMEVLAA